MVLLDSSDIILHVHIGPGKPIAYYHRMCVSFLQDAQAQVQGSTALSQLAGESSLRLIDFIGLAGGLRWPIMIVFNDVGIRK